MLGLCYLTEVKGLTCLSCHKAASINDCLATSATCDDNSEECFLDKIILPDMSVVFTAGCRAKAICDLIASAIGKRSFDKRDNVACANCCNTAAKNDTGIPCNGYLCNQNPRVPNHGAACAVCDTVSDYNQCAVTQQCPDNEICQIKVKIFGGKLTYELGCEQKTQCDHTLAAYQATHNKKSDHGDTSICHACCTGRNCNKDNCFSLIKSQKCNNPAICGP